MKTTIECLPIHVRQTFLEFAINANHVISDPIIEIGETVDIHCQLWYSRKTPKHPIKDLRQTIRQIHEWTEIGEKERR